MLWWLVPAVVGLVEAERRGATAARWALKPLASGLFLAAGVASLSPAGAPGWLLVGLAASFVGDLLLLARTTAPFLAGIAAFAAAHLADGVAFVARGVSPAGVAAAALPLAAVAVAVMVVLSPHLRGPLRVAVPAYVVLISGMVALAAGTASAAPGGATLLAGALLFYLSDLCVARERFVRRHFANKAFGLPLYYAAQATLIIGFGEPHAP